MKKLTATQRLILLFLADAPKPFADILTYLAIHPTYLYQLLKSLQNSGLIVTVSNSHPTLYALPSSSSAANTPDSPLTPATA